MFLKVDDCSTSSTGNEYAICLIQRSTYYIKNQLPCLDLDLLKVVGNKERKKHIPQMVVNNVEDLPWSNP